MASPEPNRVSESSLGGTLWKYLHPLSLIDHTTEVIWPLAEPTLDALGDDAFQVCDKLFNLAAIMLVHHSFEHFSWGSFFQVAFVLGVFKQVLILRREKIDNLVEQDPEYKHDARDEKEEENGEENRPRFGADKVEEFCVRNRKPSLDWLNKIILTLWLNFRAYSKFKVLHELWPKVKLKLKDTSLKHLEIHDFNIGDKPVRVRNIECIAYSETEIILDFEIAYDGNANITITYSQKSLNISIPVTLQKFSVSNIKLRVVLKNLIDHIPFVGGIQVFFLESPTINWQTADVAKVVDLPGLDTLLKGAIENQIVKRFVLPNRLSLPIKLPETMVKKLKDLQLPVVQGDECLTALPVPVGVVRVTAVKAEGLRPADFGFQQYTSSKNLNPFSPKTFACSELLPKRCSSDPYVRISIGRANHRSSAVSKNLNPEWNFACEFPVEYYHKALVNIEIFDQDIGLVSDDPLGKITEKLKRIKDKGLIEGWYNCQIYQGRAYLKFEWIPLLPEPAGEHDDASETSGVVCLLIGTLHSKDIVRPTCCLEMREGKDLAKSSSLDAVSSDVSWTFNEGKVFRIKNVYDKDSFLTVKVYDNKGWHWIGERRFKVKRLLERPLHGYYKFPNPHSSAKPIGLSLSSRILYDS